MLCVWKFSAAEYSPEEIMTTSEMDIMAAMLETPNGSS